MKKTVAILTLVIALFAAIAPIYVSYDLHEKGQEPEPVRSIALDRSFMSDLTRTFENSSPVISYNLFYEGKELQSLITLNESLENTGTEAITPQEMYEPLAIEIEEPWRILTIENKSSNHQSRISPTWNRISERRFEASPFLLNPGDKVSVVIYATTNEENYKESLGSNLYKNPEITHWSARILNISKIENKEEEEKKSNNERIEKLKEIVEMTRQWPQIYIFLHGHGLLFFLLCTCIFSFIYIYLLRLSFDAYDLREPKAVILIFAAFFMSMATAEVFSYYLIPSFANAYLEIIYSEGESLYFQNPNFIIPFLSAVSLVYLGWKARIYERK